MSTIILASVAVIIACIALFVAVKGNKRAKIATTNTLVLNKKILKLKTDIKVNLSSLTGMGQRILNTENRIDLLTDKIAHQDFYDKREVNYRQADKMMDLGGQEQDLVDCGLTTAEARLMKILKTK